MRLLRTSWIHAWAIRLAALVVAIFVADHAGGADAAAAWVGPHYLTPITQRTPTHHDFDVVVYGGTPGGVTAAIQASRMGKRAALVSFDRFVGGMTSGGLTATDLGNVESIGGLASEFYERVGALKDFSPSRAEAIYRAMLGDAGVTVLTTRPLASVKLDGQRIASLVSLTGEIVAGAMFIDATYEGDLLGAGGVSYHVGREPRNAFDESLAGQWQSVSWKGIYQFCELPISPYAVPDDRASGLLPEIASEPPGALGQGDYRVQAYNFRMRLSTRPERVPFPKPPGYDARRYALLARFMNASPDIAWTLDYTTKPMTDGPVQMRDGDSNNAGSFSSDYVGGSHRWPDGTFDATSFNELPPPRRGLPVPLDEIYAIRERIFQDHLNYQAGLMHFLATDSQVPASLRERVNRFGLDAAEFGETGHWPHALYVREGRRMVADYVMTQADCESTRAAEDSVGLGSYNMDSHFCQRVATTASDGRVTVQNEGAFGRACPKPYPIAFRSIVPKKEECENLLVPVCLSSTHVAYGSIRMEPVFMILGQSAGTAAVMAIDAQCSVQDVPYATLAERLRDDGQILTWPVPPTNEIAP